MPIDTRWKVKKEWVAPLRSGFPRAERKTMWLKVDKPGTLHALALCNVHGMWESSKVIGVG